MEKEKLAIVVFSCDAYSDLWDNFFDCFNINWPDNEFECFLINNHKRFDRKGVKVINAGDSDWTSRARYALLNIHHEYVLTFLDDYFISRKVDHKKIVDLLPFIQKENVSYYQLDITDKEDYYKWEKYKYDYMYIIPKTREYWVDTSIAIWNKQFFLELLGDFNYSAWEFEIARNLETRIPDHHKEKICLFDSRLIISMCSMVIQGKFSPKALKKMKQNGFYINTNDRPILNFREAFKNDLKRFFSRLSFGRNLFKGIGRLIGFKFISDKYIDQLKDKV